MLHCYWVGKIKTQSTSNYYHQKTQKLHTWKIQSWLDWGQTDILRVVDESIQYYNLFFFFYYNLFRMQTVLKIKLHTVFELAVLLLGLYTYRNKSKDIERLCARMFITAVSVCNKETWGKSWMNYCTIVSFFVAWKQVVDCSMYS